MEYPRNYEEAKVIIQNIPDNEYYKKVTSVHKKRAALVTAISFGVAGAIGLVSSIPIVALPVAAIASYLSFVPVINYRKVAKRAKNGEYFENKTPEQIMAIARECVDEYNDYSSKKHR